MTSYTRTPIQTVSIGTDVKFILMSAELGRTESISLAYYSCYNLEGGDYLICPDM